MRRSAMAGVAGDFAMAFEVLLVDVHHHFNHGASNLFGFLVVFVEGVFDVAVFTFNAERSGDELHSGDELFGWNVFHDLNVLEFLSGGSWSGRRILRARSDDRAENCNDSERDYG
jgi:hypothetical protein